MEKRKSFYYLPIVFIAGMVLLMNTNAFADNIGDPSDAGSIPKFVTPLVIPPVMDSSAGPNKYNIAVREFNQQILPGGIWKILNPEIGDAVPEYVATPVWSYGPAEDATPALAPDPTSQFNYPAYTFETTANVPVSVRWINELVMNPDDCFDKFGRLNKGAAVDSCHHISHLLPIDQTLHWANPVMDCREGNPRTDCAGDNPDFYTGPVPIVTHVHGAHVDPHSDGYPEAWWLPAATNLATDYTGIATSGSFFDDATGMNDGTTGYADYVYRQDQPAATLWYHDHSLGMTRNNVYAGPAGFWLVRGGKYDGARDLNGKPARFPGPAPVAGQGVLALNVPGDPVRNSIREIPIVIQDRSFNSDGSLFYPDNRAFFEGLNVPGVSPQFPGEGYLDIPYVPDPTLGGEESDIAPIWNPEAFFNVMVVNGVSWPELEVAPALYRLRFLNGCNSRFLWLKFRTLTAEQPEVDVYQIGAEQGFLPVPASLNNDLDGSGDGTAQILMALAERADVLVDFRGLTNGTEIELLNIGPDEPFGGGTPYFDCETDENAPEHCFEPADLDTTGKVMRFKVNSALNGYGMTDPIKLNGKPNPNAATDPGDLVPNAEPALGMPSNTREVSLNEGESETVCWDDDGSGGLEEVLCPNGEPVAPKEALLGTVVEGFGIPLKWTDIGIPKIVPFMDGTSTIVNVTENPALGAVEDWDIYNFTVDAHPIHLHLVRFEVIERRPIGAAGGSGVGPELWETGFKDTVIAYPGEITRIRALFDIEGLYVWHCHIVEHEDNEMMRPYVVGLPTAP
jgi:spore coat protein A